MKRSLPTGTALALGGVTGLLSGLFGVGGGVILVPGMVLLARIPQHVAHATSLVAILITAPAALVGFAVDGSVAYQAGAGIAVGAVTGAVVGAAAMHRLSAARLRQGFALLLLVVAIRLLLPAGGAAPPEAAIDSLWALAAYVGLGLAAGVLSALMGVGGGVIMVPAMVLLLGLDQHTAEGTSLLVIVPTALVGAWRHSNHGYTDWRLGLLIGIGGIAGALLGAQAALALPAATLQRLFAVFLGVMGVRMLLRSRPARDPAS